MHDFAFPLTVTDRLTIRHFRRDVQSNARTSFDVSLSEIMKSEIDFCTDPATQRHILIGACATSAYRAALENGLCAATAKARVRHSTSTLWKWTTILLMRSSTLFARDKFETIKRHTKERTPTSYGPSFTIGFEETDNGFVSEVKVCGFRTFLARHDALVLLELFCEWDHLWINALPKSILFSRPTTQAFGGKTCRFEFRRDQSE